MSGGSDERIVTPAAVPELAPIIRAGLRSKVRLFDLWCLKGDRLVEVLQVAGRPLAMGQSRRARGTAFPGGSRTMWIGRGLDVGMWLDGEALLPRIEYSCAHERVVLSGEWLRAQLAEGVRRRVLDQALRNDPRARIRPA